MGALHNLGILSRRRDASRAVVMFFGNPAIDMLQDAAGDLAPQFLSNREFASGVWIVLSGGVSDGS